VTVNHRLLSDFRSDHGPALDALFTQVIASLVDQDIVKASRISQDGVRVRVSAGASSFGREEPLQELLQQAKAEQRAGEGEQGEKVRQRQPRVSTTYPEARRMKMPNGGFNPAVNVQLATDTESRAIVGIDVTFEGTDSVGLSASMRNKW
jgi:hypothetical protein